MRTYWLKMLWKQDNLDKKEMEIAETIWLQQYFE